MSKLTKYTFILIFVGVLAAFILALVYQATLGPIEKYKKDILLASQKAVLAEAQEFKTEKMIGPVLEKFLSFYPAADKNQEFFSGWKNKQVCGYIFTLTPQGYGGPVKMLVGVDKTGKIVGLKILEQKETPGLGSHILDENFKNTGKSFLNQFFGKIIRDKIEPKQNIQAITGATISTRAICTGVKQALELWEIVSRK